MVGGERVGVAVTIALKRVAIAVEVPAVELDDQPFSGEQRVDLVTGDVRAHHRVRQPVLLAELRESVLPARSGGSPADVDERLQPSRTPVMGEPFDDIGN